MRPSWSCHACRTAANPQKDHHQPPRMRWDPSRVRRSETGRSWWVLTSCLLSQLLQAFYQQQEEIRGLREQLQHKDVSIWDILTSLLMCLGCKWRNQIVVVSVVSGHNHSAGAGDQKHQEQFEGHLLIGPISFNAGPTTNEMLLAWQHKRWTNKDCLLMCFSYLLSFHFKARLFGKHAQWIFTKLN